MGRTPAQALAHRHNRAVAIETRARIIRELHVMRKTIPTALAEFVDAANVGRRHIGRQLARLREESDSEAVDARVRLAEDGAVATMEAREEIIQEDAFQGPRASCSRLVKARVEANAPHLPAVSSRQHRRRIKKRRASGKYTRSVAPKPKESNEPHYHYMMISSGARTSSKPLGLTPADIFGKLTQ